MVGTLHVVDEGLLARARRDGASSVAAAVSERLHELRVAGAEVVCCTCSTIGDIAESADVAAPAFRVDRPMARRAVESGSRIGVVVALEATLGSSRTLIEHEASLNGAPISLETVVAKGAWARFEAGDTDGYVRAVCEAGRTLAGKVDVIVLAQASMAVAEDLLADLDVPVLSSPRLAVEFAVGRLPGAGGPPG